MFKVIFFSGLIGLVLAGINLFCFLKIGPFLTRINKNLNGIVSLGPFLLGVISIGFIPRYFESRPDMGMTIDSTNDTIFAVVMDGIWFISFLLGFIFSISRDGNSGERISVRNRTTGFERFLAGIFIFLQLMGPILGVFIFLKIICLVTGNPLDFDAMNATCSLICALSVIPGLTVGLLGFSIPFFLLLIKPFYNRESVTLVANKGRREELDTRFPMNVLYRTTFFWIDLFYPKKSGKN